MLRQKIPNQYYCRQYSKVAISNFLYLGQTEAIHEEDTKHRLVITKINFSKMKIVLISRKISLLYVHIYISLHPVLEWRMGLLID